jgi:hypothetical protein
MALALDTATHRAALHKAINDREARYARALDKARKDLIIAKDRQKRRTRARAKRRVKGFRAISSGWRSPRDIEREIGFTGHRAEVLRRLDRVIRYAGLAGSSRDIFRRQLPALLAEVKIVDFAETAGELLDEIASEASYTRMSMTSTNAVNRAISGREPYTSTSITRAVKAADKVAEGAGQLAAIVRGNAVEVAS